ncbi:hypothetical protein PAALTS15_25759 [Paenibacillus alvei TS-15]|jgi:Protein of unknown function (DUF3886)|uniref:DUF3886 domain-containing protein n=2 Tax=Paenibacillus alvei TaxID=44250 RepID=S9TPR3_PAEAL|nr:hypothetical protein PAALTS15_25759 [Paenibacillus alvei TS-15]
MYVDEFVSATRISNQSHYNLGIYVRMLVLHEECCYNKREIEVIRMGKKRRTAAAPTQAATEKPATLKDLLSPDVLNKLKTQAKELQVQEDTRKEHERQKAEEARRAEQKKLDNNFEYLLNNSSLDWRKYKK